MADALICENRNEFVKTIKSKILSEPSNLYCFIGQTGVGKKYVLEKLENELDTNFKIYRVASDSILVRNKKRFLNQYGLEMSFSLCGLVGLALSSQKDTSSKVNYIISNLKTLSYKKKIFIAAVDYEYLTSEGREFLSLLINSRKIIEDKLDKQITVLVTSNGDFFSQYQNAVKIRFTDYSRKDIFYYLQNTLHCSPVHLTNKKINQLYRLCGTNLDLVNSYYHYLLYNTEEEYSIEAIVDQKLNYYIMSGRGYNLSNEDLENILIISSSSISYVTPHMISSLNHKMIEAVECGLNCAVKGYFLKKEDEINKHEYENYFFISNQEKAELCKRAIINQENIMLRYYIYLSSHMEDIYFERALYLYRYFGSINKEVFALLILGISRYYMLDDNNSLETIRNFIHTHAESEVVALFSRIDTAYEEHINQRYKESNDIMRTISFSMLSPVTVAELRRLEFRNRQLGYITDKVTMSTLAMQLKAYIEKKIFLLNELIFEPKEEQLLTLRIISDLAPYVLDDQNDTETFNELYDRSLVIGQYIHNNAVKKSYANYIINVFNRKAFLFAAPATALVYYEEAEAYFRDNKIMNELAITLASKAGMNINLKRYEEAIANCEDSLKIINQYEISIQYVEKVYNNLYIAKFLMEEQKNGCITDINNYALETIEKLKKIAGNQPCGKKHVILTNIASLYLYLDRDDDYQSVKHSIEESLNCNDVANILDITINDFYRYYFAWFEFYRVLKSQNWKACINLLSNLNGCYPSIFHNVREMELRVEAATRLVSQKISLDAREYCLHFLEYASSNDGYFSRGLLLSDLQFTSSD